MHFTVGKYFSNKNAGSVHMNCNEDVLELLRQSVKAYEKERFFVLTNLRILIFSKE